MTHLQANTVVTTAATGTGTLRPNQTPVYFPTNLFTEPHTHALQARKEP